MTKKALIVEPASLIEAAHLHRMFDHRAVRAADAQAEARHVVDRHDVQVDVGRESPVQSQFLVAIALAQCGRAEIQEWKRHRFLDLVNERRHHKHQQQQWYDGCFVFYPNNINRKVIIFNYDEVAVDIDNDDDDGDDATVESGLRERNTSHAADNSAATTSATPPAAAASSEPPPGTRPAPATTAAAAAAPATEDFQLYIDAPPPPPPSVPDGSRIPVLQDRISVGLAPVLVVQLFGQPTPVPSLVASLCRRPGEQQHPFSAE